jgi:hypothetical protein
MTAVGVRFGALLAFTALTMSPALAQTHHGHHAPAQVLGSVSFPVACNEQAQASFNKGMLLQPTQAARCRIGARRSLS